MDGDKHSTEASSNGAQQDLLLTINTGSSSLKAAVFRAAQPEQRLLAAEFQRIGRPGGSMRHLVSAPGIESKETASVDACRVQANPPREADSEK